MKKSLSKIMNGSRREINAYFLDIDDSHRWPMCGRFNATERAIRIVRKFERDSGDTLHGVGYCHALENEISRIVNREV